MISLWWQLYSSHFISLFSRYWIESLNFESFILLPQGIQEFLCRNDLKWYGFVPEDFISHNVFLLSDYHLQIKEVGGIGRMCKLATPISIRDAVDTLKKHIGVPFVQVALARNSEVGKLVCFILVIQQGYYCHHDTFLHIGIVLLLVWVLIIQFG